MIQQQALDVFAMVFCDCILFSSWLLRAPGAVFVSCCFQPCHYCRLKSFFFIYPLFIEGVVMRGNTNDKNLMKGQCCLTTLLSLCVALLPSRERGFLFYFFFILWWFVQLRKGKPSSQIQFPVCSQICFWFSAEHLGWVNQSKTQNPLGSMALPWYYSVLCSLKGIAILPPFQSSVVRIDAWRDLRCSDTVAERAMQERKMGF